MLFVHQALTTAEKATAVGLNNHIKKGKVMKTSKLLKSLLAVLLAVVLVIPGVYFGTEGQEEVKAAEAVQTDMLNIKVQVAEDGEDVIRVITSVDSLDYRKVGFELATPSGTKTYETTTVYQRIVSEVTDEEYEFSPKLVDETSEYFVTAKFKATAGTDYTVRAFACALGTDTKTYGPSRVVALEDAETDTINMMVDFATTANATYDVYDGSTKIGTAKVIGDKNVRITLDSKKVTDFPSATKLTFKSGSTSVGTAIYRNYYTKYTGEGTEDQTWYTVDTSATEFIVASSADLYGLADLVNAGTQLFANKKVIQIRNIEVNKGTATADGWAAAEGESTHEWVGIGNASKGFSGTFDGDENTVRGLYETKQYGTDTQRMGLFGTLNSNGKIQNVIVRNSYYSFPSGMSNVGGVVGYCQGNLENIYVAEDVYMKSASGSAGGVCGMFSISSTSYSQTFKNIWFAGTFTSASANIGGIIGRSYRGKVTLENCLFTGTVEGSTWVGGLVGGANGGGDDSGTTANYNRTTIKNSISVGTVKSASADRIGSVVGGINNGDVTNINVYTTENRVYTGTGSGFNTNGDAVGMGLIWYTPGNNLNVKGVPMAITTELNGANAYTKTEFDFWTEDNEDGAWVAIEGSTPILKIGADLDKAIKTLNGKRSSDAWYYNAYTKQAISSEWQMALPSAAAFELDSAADLNGLAAKKINYKGYIVKLTKDIELNPGWKPQIDENGNLLNGTGTIAWEPIGTTSAGTSFAGTFDGQGHFVSGMNCTSGAGMSGMFTRLEGGSIVKNLKILDSYFKATSATGTTLNDVGSLVGYTIGTTENIYSNAIVVADTWDAGGLIGRLRSDTATAVRTVDNCWFDGQLLIVGNTSLASQNGAYGGIAGRLMSAATTSTFTFTNCLNTASIKRTVGDTSEKVGYGGGIVGGDFGGNSVLNIKDCLNVGTVENVGKYFGGLAGIYRGTVTVEDSYTITESCSKSVGQKFNGTVNGSSTYTDSAYQVARNSMLLDAAKTGAPGLFEEGDKWVCDVESGIDRGTPILESMSTWWQEYKFDDGVLKVLLVGNSFCYYHTDELYGMLEADGTKAIVANVYDSGCTMQEHVTFLNNNTKRYDYIKIDDGVKTSVGSQTLTQCLEAEDWDVISFQQHFDPSEAMDYQTASSITLPYAKTMYDYLKTNYSDARLLWQMTWAYQVGYIGHGGLTPEQKEAQDAKYKVLDTAKQTLNYENISAVARAVCEENDVELVPNGDAWQLARTTVGDILCNKSGTDLAADTQVGDNYHDGDVGGGQFVNACGWYEVITGRDCRNNTFEPSYSLLINTEFNAELTTKADVIAALKEAVHSAVKAMDE